MMILRFAPSPTGHLHIGGARTALYNWLYCRKNKGKFILRIDDTDDARNKSDSIKSIIDDLTWLGIDWDIGPDKSDPADYQSSHRNDLYIKYANILIASDLAYKDTDDTIRLKVTKTDDLISFDDVLKGKISVVRNTINDFVLIRSNNIATYNFATVIDDHLMGVTHIFRADEHLLNTPKQLLIYDAFNWKYPVFGHMGLITDLSGKKLSKRTGDSSVLDFKNKGILSPALLNYLAFLGWGDNNQGQLLSKDQLIQKFSIDKVKSSSSCFDLKLLLSLNSKYIRNLSVDDLGSILNTDDLSFLNNFKTAFISRVNTVNDLVYYYNQINCFDPNHMVYKFDTMTDFSKSDMLSCIDDLILKKDIDSLNLTYGKKLVSSLIRFALIGQKDGCGNDLLFNLIKNNDLLISKYINLKHHIMML